MAYSVNCHLVSAWILCSFGEIKQLDYLCPNYNLEVCISHTFLKMQAYMWADEPQSLLVHVLSVCVF